MLNEITLPDCWSVRRGRRAIRTPLFSPQRCVRSPPEQKIAPLLRGTYFPERRQPYDGRSQPWYRFCGPLLGWGGLLPPEEARCGSLYLDKVNT